MTQDTPTANRRWAELHGKSRKEGYVIGIDHIEEVLDWCRESGVKTVTMWGFSTDNFRRDKEEIFALFELFKKNLVDGLVSKRKERHKIRVKFLGRTHLFPKELQELFRNAEEKTKDCGPYQLNLLLSYGGREELVDAINSMINEGMEEVDEKAVSDHLYTAGIRDPDLIIRTSGEKRLSGLLPWQSCYSEFYFSEKLWPDFSKEDFRKALEDYANRKRRYGK